MLNFGYSTVRQHCSVQLCSPWLAMGWGEQGKEERGWGKGLSFSTAQTDLAGGWAFGRPRHIRLPPGPSRRAGDGISEGVPGSAAFCGAALGRKGAKCPTVLGVTRRALSKPLFLANSAALDLCAATLRLALGWTADALKKYLYKCDYVGVCVCVSVWIQPRQTHLFPV